MFFRSLVNAEAMSEILVVCIASATEISFAMTIVYGVLAKRRMIIHFAPAGAENTDAGPALLRLVLNLRHLIARYSTRTCERANVHAQRNSTQS